jgi:hypothetical protein
MGRIGSRASNQNPVGVKGVVYMSEQGYESPSIVDLGAFSELTQTAAGKPNEKALPATGS